MRDRPGMRSFGAVKRSLFLLCSLAPLLAAAQRAPKPARFDAAVVAIIVPSDDPAHAELNPAVQEPRIVLGNRGTETLSGISIRYGTLGFKPRMFAWTGRLAPGATTEVQLTHLIDMAPGLNTFSVSLGDPNGRKDKNKADNTRTATFTAAPVLASPLTVRVRVPAGSSGRCFVENTRGPLPLDKTWSAAADTVLQERLDLSPGSYLLRVADEGAVGHASVRIIGPSGDLIAVVRGKEKTGSTYQFKVEYGAVVGPGPDHDAELIRLPGRGLALADVFASEKAVLVVSNSQGEPVKEWPVPERKDTVVRIDLSEQPVGSYAVKLRMGAKEIAIGTVDLLDAPPR